MSLRIGSLCTGYGGLDMAVQNVLGGTPVWVADNDPGASRILAHHYPDVPNLGDLTAVDWRQVEPVDVVCGGYPCQPFSSAGKRKGVFDDRHIWPHIARALGVLRPRYAVFENVAGHLSLGFDTVLADLAALGFDARWSCVRASDVGAAHRRNRLFLLAWPADTTGPGRERPGFPGRPAGRRLAVAHSLDVGGDRCRPRGTGRDEPAARGLAAADAGGRRFEGGSAGDSPESAQQFTDSVGSVVREAVADPEGDGRQQGWAEPAGQQGGPDAPLGGGADWGPYAAAIARWEGVIGRRAPRPTDALGRLNPPFVEWLMGLPAGHVTDVPGLSRTAQLKALGNGVVPQQATAALHALMNSDEAAAAA